MQHSAVGEHAEVIWLLERAQQQQQSWLLGGGAERVIGVSAVRPRRPIGRLMVH